MRSIRLGFLLFPMITVALVSGCGRSVPVSWWEPTAPIGAAQTVVVTDAYGREDAVDAVATMARDQVLAHGYFGASDRQHRERLEVGRRGDVWLDTGAPLQEGVIYLRVDVLEWNATTVDTSTVTEQGEAVSSQTTASVLLSLTAADNQGLLLDDEQLEASTAADHPVADDEVAGMLEAAAQQALGKGLQLLLPVHRQDALPLDDRDEALHSALDRVPDLDASRAALDAFIAEHPHHAGALYDRAVIEDASGAYDDALRDYGAALDLDGARAEYGEGRSGCLQRRASARALGR